MIYITGDTHGEENAFTEAQRPGEWKIGEGDYLIVCGDFSYVFLNTPEERARLNKIEREKPYTILFCDGNHENHAELNSLPVEMWHGGKVHRVRENIIHLMRGQIYEIEGKKFFVMGGELSHDRARRTLGYSYWTEELPSESEYEEARQNLKNAGMCVDYIITHGAPRTVVQHYLHQVPDEHERDLLNFLDWVMFDVEYKKWFFGHFHLDKEITAKLRCVLFDIVPIE
jgi:predicted phosphodiesterase